MYQKHKNYNMLLLRHVVRLHFRLARLHGPQILEISILNFSNLPCLDVWIYMDRPQIFFIRFEGNIDLYIFFLRFENYNVLN